jgi:serine/threonine protein kinase/Flp pilus assembly protein TadD
MSSDRNLLFGILALQMDFISRDGLIKGMNAWVLHKARPLGEILQEQGALPADAHALLESLVAKHLQLHGDADKSLAALRSVGPVPQELQQIADAELHASLAHVSAAPGDGADPCATTGVATVGLPTSTGLRFRILRPHARGGLGQVSVARDEELHREVALKEIQEDHADDMHSRARFLLEAQITGGLEHPGIVPVYGLGCYADGRPYYAMRFIKGDSLQEAIARFHQAERPGRDPGERTLAFRQLLGRFVNVCNAVAYAHSRGVLHRDLKPGNVMLGPYGETLVVDWGLAKVVGKEHEPAAAAAGADEPMLQPTASDGVAPTQMGSALGTPAYMPPEQACGRMDLLGPASDVYSLGATLYSLLTGQPPVQANDKEEMLRRVERGEFPPSRQVKRAVPAALEAICLRAMALRPENRYPSARALADEIEHWLADEPVQAHREPWAKRAGRWMRHHRTLVAALAASVFAALVMGGLAWYLVTAEKTARLEQEAKLERAERDKAEQRAERTRRAEAQLRHAVERRNEARLAAGDEPAKWNEAFSAVQRAEALLAGGDADAGVRRQVQRMLREMEAETRDRRLLAALDEARLQAAAAGEEGGFDKTGASARYAQAFRQDGLDIFQTNPRALARSWQGRAIKAQLVAALDEWAEITPDAKVLKRLVTLLAQVDPHPASFGRRWRQARGNRQQLLKLIATGEVRNLAPSDLARLGRSLTAAGAVPEAVGLLRQGWARHPADFWINFELAYALYNLEKPPWAEVSRFCTAALAIRPRSAAAANNLGVALAAQPDLQGAIAAYRKAIDINPKYADAYYNLGNALQVQQDLKGAIAAYGKAIDIDPKYARAYTSLGIALASQGDLKRAIASHRKAVKLDPNNANAHMNLGNALVNKGQLDKGIASLRKAVELDPQLALAHSNLGYGLYAKGEVDEAIDCFKKAIELNPKFAPVYNYLGAALLDGKHDPGGAISSFKKAIEFDPKLVIAHSNLGRALAGNGRAEEAIPCYQKVVELDPNNSMAYLTLAALQAWFGQDKELAATCARALQVARDTRNPMMADCVAKTCSLRQADDQTHKAALVLARRAVELGKEHPFRVWFQMAVGMAEYRSRHYTAAEAALLAAAQLAKSNYHVLLTAAFYRAMSLFRLGKKDEARKLATLAVANMKALPVDEKKLLDRESGHDDLILWLAYKEAKALIKFEAAPPKAKRDRESN